MKRFGLVLAAAVAALVLVLGGCGTVEADIGGEDAYEAPSEDTSLPPPPVEEKDTEESDTSLPPPPAAVDKDGDGVVAGNGPNQDCNDNNPLVHPYATETCANGLDDDCDGVIDEGCVVPPTGTSPTADADGDGYPDGPSDCAPNNANIHPGAVELCNSIDDDCDGVIDEQCGTTPPPPVSGTTATFTVTYPDNSARTLNVQVYDHKSDLGGWWDKSASDSDKDVTLTFADVPDGICGFRFNVSEGNPASWWLCYGNGSTAQLDPDAGVVIVYKGVTYTKGSLKTWSAQGGTNAGCSALLQTNSASDCSP